MSAILQQSTNYVQSQSHRIYPENWEGEGWFPIPPEFETIAVANAPYIEVIYAEDGKTITSIIPIEKPEPEPEPEVNINEQVLALSRVMAVQAAPTMSDKQALTMPDLFPTWEQVLEAGEPLGKDMIVNDGGTLYRVVQDNTTPQAGQPPHGEGMLAVYRPIDVGSTGGADDPIPWLYGMDCYEGKYYTYEGKTYLCKQNMTPCVWAPNTPGLWQWEVQEDT